jgi:hypothetical protein
VIEYLGAILCFVWFIINVIFLVCYSYIMLVSCDPVVHIIVLTVKYLKFLTSLLEHFVSKNLFSIFYCVFECWQSFLSSLHVDNIEFCYRWSSRTENAGVWENFGWMECREGLVYIYLTWFSDRYILVPNCGSACCTFIMYHPDNWTCWSCVLLNNLGVSHAAPQS